MFDFTKNIALDSKNAKLYRKLQLGLYFIFLLLTIYLGFLIAFPSKNLFFDFLKPDSNKNNLGEVLFSNEESPKKGVAEREKSLKFNADINLEYSSVKLDFEISNDSEDPQKSLVYLKKSYQAFLYPEGKPMGFKDGSLLSHDSDYYLVSDGRLRKFAQLEVLKSFGYATSNFSEVSKEELAYNPPGENIENGSSFPNGMIFEIENDYYILADQKMKKFSGENPFLTQYESDQALKKEIDFLKKFEISPEVLGFSDGSLISNAESVFIASEGKILPIDSVQTFEAKGFLWENVIPAGTDELSFYEREKLFNFKGIHPSGTLFKSVEDDAYYLIGNKEKHLLPGEKIARSWNKKEPILVSKKALEQKNECVLEKTFFNHDVFSCEITLENIQKFPGKNYQFEVQFENEVALKNIAVEFEKKATQENFKFFLLGLYNSIVSRYAQN